jgi:hypothetical protein
MPSKKDIEAGRAFVRLFLKNDMRKQLSGALQSAGKTLKGWGRSTMVAGAGMTAAGTAILAPIAAAVKSFAAQGDELDKMAKRTGVAGSALAEFSFAAEQSGANLDDFEKSIKRMQRTIEDGKRGLTTAVDGLDLVGLSVQDLQGLSPEDQFQKIADGMAAIVDPSTKAAAAQMLFGRSGTQLIPMLNDLSQLRQEARDLGLIPAEGEIENAAKVTDALNRVRRAVKAAFFSLGASLAGPAARARNAEEHCGQHRPARQRQGVHHCRSGRDWGRSRCRRRSASASSSKARGTSLPQRPGLGPLLLPPVWQ